VITPHTTDFIGPISTSSIHLKLGRMTNGMEIAGTGLVCWTFDTTTGENLPLKTMSYYVLQAKVRLISPQRVFDLEENQGVSYYGDRGRWRGYIVERESEIAFGHLFQNCSKLISLYQKKNQLRQNINATRHLSHRCVLGINLISNMVPKKE
jgi:hypothetical protein